MGARPFVLRAVVALFVVASLSLPASAFACPNEERREEQNSTYLPDCRAYELVSPTDKNGSDVTGENNLVHVSASGEKVFYTALAGFGEVNGSGSFGYTSYVASRDGSHGWSSRGVTPRPTPQDYQVVLGATSVVPYDESLKKVFVEGYDMADATDDLHDNSNLYVEDAASGALQTLTTPIGVEPFSFELLLAFDGAYRASSADLGVVVFASYADLMPGLPSGSKLYEWNHGTLEMAGVLPDGSLPAGGAAGVDKGISVIGDGGEFRHAVSRDGSRVLFMSPVDGSKPAQIYLRRNSSSTVWVSQSEASAPAPEPHEVEYLDMSPDGSKVLFTSSDRLTDSDPGGEGVGIYLYSDGPDPGSEQNLTYITRVVPNLYGSIRYTASELYEAMSEDAKRIYFFTGPNGTLTQTGVYVWDEGKIRLVTPLEAPLGKGPVLDNFTESAVETSTDGRYLAFVANEQLTEAPLGPDLGHKLTAMYLYDEATGDLRCVSCLPSGAPTTSRVDIVPRLAPSPTSSPIKPRFLTDDGKYVFFNTTDALVSSDVNDLEDAYEYNSETGTVSLLSSGIGGLPSGFADSSADGSNVTIVSRRSYLAEDTDSLIDVYDVRENGGFPQPKPATGRCVGDECQGVPSAAPSFDTASGFVGAGNVAHRAQEAAAKRLTRAQKLARALKACKRKRGRARRRCVALARKRYGAKKASKRTSRRARG